MKESFQSHWDELENNKNYFDKSDIFLQDKYRLIKILK